MNTFTEDEVQKINSAEGEDTRLNAFRILSRAFSLLPVQPKSKVPARNNWNSCCQKKEAFRREQYRGLNAGIACGPASGVIVVDIDDHVKFDLWLKEQGLPLPQTFSVKSGGKSTHLYYKYPHDGQEYGNKAIPDENRKHIADIRGLGGFVVAPGSLHPDTGRPYSILKNIPIGDAPKWLLEMCRKGERLEPLGIPLIESKASDASFGQDLERFPKWVSERIRTSYPASTRSEKVWNVILSLLEEGVSGEEILDIFEHYPIGEKYREKGLGKVAWLQGEIERAKMRLLEKQSFTQEDGQKDSRPSSSFECISALDILQADHSLSFMIERLWPEGEAMLLVGQSGVGKSHLALEIAMSLAGEAQDSFLGQFPVLKQGKTLFIQSENTIRGLTSRMTRMVGTGVDRKILNSLIFPNIGGDVRLAGNFKEKGFRETVIRTIEQYEPLLLVIDPLVSFHEEDENDNSRMRKILDEISLVADRTGVSVLLVHHLGKVGSQGGTFGGRGASAIGDWAPNILELKKEADHLELIHRKGRNVELLSPVLLEMTPSLRFRPMPTRFKHDPHVEKVLAALNSLEGHAKSQKELIAAVLSLETQPIGRTAARDWLMRAIEKGCVIEDSSSGAVKGYRIA